MSVASTARSSALACALGLAVCAYFLAFPLQPNQSDEGLILYNSERLLEGQVLYRDFFEFITPGAMYFFAGVFALTGPSLLAARVATAMLNGLSASLLFSLARRVADDTVALAAGLVFAVVCLPVWRQASPHWLSTCLGLATAATVLAERWSPEMRAAGAGALAGLTACVHQHHGVFLGIWLVLALAALARLAPAGDRWRSWSRQTAWAAGAGGAIVLAVLGYCAWRASVARVVYALYTFVFESYQPPKTGKVGWAGSIWLSAGDLVYTWPWLLRWLPAALALEATSLAWRLRSERGRDETIRGCLFLLAATMAASILYYPDFIHVSFVAPFLLIVVARVVHGLLKRVRVEVRVAFAAMLVVALIAKGSGNLVRAWAAAPERAESPIGTLRLSATQHTLLDAVRTAVGVGRPALFSYPADAWLYLAVPAENPTPYSLLIPGYNTPQQFTEAIAAIERRHAPYLVLLTGLLHDDDPILGYARQRFEPVAIPWPYTVYRRAS
ncbi:MAG: hypothetical protein E6J79_13015 [Deltaproteobacteria bacterium]|nr:MAG: hypothetical protein E6J79_13015 [Deltaproteobacteria bacterium]